MDFKDINQWFLAVAILSVAYILFKNLHAYTFQIKQDGCNMCKSKKYIRIRRDKILKLFPFNSKKYYCKECRKEYLIIQFFKKQVVISDGMT